MNETVLIVTVIELISILFAVFVFASRYKKVPPDKAMVVYGRMAPPGHPHPFRVISGGGKFIIPIVEDREYLDLGVKESLMEMDNVRTDPREGSIPVRLTLAVMHKISSGRDGMMLAAETIMGKTDEEVRRMVEAVIEGTVREVSTGFSPRDLDLHREQVSAKVGAIASQDLTMLGIEVCNINIIRVIHKGVDRVG